MDKVYEAAKLILQYNSTLSDESGNKQGYLWPCFIGPTGSGKTSRAEKLAKEFNLQQHKLLLQTMNPEEIGGIPRVNSTTNKLEWYLDSWAYSPGLIILDELDKPDREHWSSILSMLTDRSIRHVKLNKSLFVAAMQPVDKEMFLSEETGKALAARLIFLPVNISDSFSHVSKKHGRKEIGFRQEKIQLPVLDFYTPRQLDWLAGFYDVMQPSDDILEVIIAGIVQKPYVKEIVDWLKNPVDETVKVSHMLKALVENPELVMQVDLAYLNLVFIHGASVQGWTEELLENITFRILTESEPSQAMEIYSNMVEAIKESPQDNDGYKNMFEPLSFNQWNDVMTRVVNRVVDHYKKLGRI